MGVEFGSAGEVEGPKPGRTAWSDDGFEISELGRERKKNKRRLHIELWDASHDKDGSDDNAGVLVMWDLVVLVQEATAAAAAASLQR